MLTDIAMLTGDLAAAGSTIAPAADILAGPQAEGVVMAAPDAGGVTSWIQDNVIPLVLTAVGVFALWRSKNGDVPMIVTMGAGVLVAFCILAMAMPGVRDGLMSWFAGFFGG